MKFVIVLACLLAVVCANEDVRVLKNEAEVNPDSFHHILELDNSIKAVQHGELKDKDNWIVEGEYSFDSKEGKPHKVTYIADKDGYHPTIIN